MAALKKYLKCLEVDCNGLVNFLKILLLVINIIKINLTFECITFSKYMCALRPGNAG
jgi:hypothetical protein